MGCFKGEAHPDTPADGSLWVDGCSIPCKVESTTRNMVYYMRKGKKENIGLHAFIEQMRPIEAVLP